MTSLSLMMKVQLSMLLVAMIKSPQVQVMMSLMEESAMTPFIATQAMTPSPQEAEMIVCTLAVVMINFMAMKVMTYSMQEVEMTCL